MEKHLRLTQEAAYGVYASGGATCFPYLSSDNNFQPMEQADYWTVDDHVDGEEILDGVARIRETTQLVTEIGPTVAQFLMGWGGVRINSAQTLPWTTTERARDLASVTADLAYAVEGGLKRTRYLGTKVQSLGLSCSSDQQKLMGTLALVAAKHEGNAVDSSTDPDATAFPLPSCSVKPTDVYLFRQLTGQVTVNGVVRTNFNSFGLSIQNDLDILFDEGVFANAIRCNGRRITATVGLRHKATNDFGAHLSGTAGAAKFKFVSGANSMEIDLKGKATIRNLTPNQPIRGENYYTITIAAKIDPASSCASMGLTFV